MYDMEKERISAFKNSEVIAEKWKSCFASMVLYVVETFKETQSNSWALVFVTGPLR